MTYILVERLCVTWTWLSDEFKTRILAQLAEELCSILTARRLKGDGVARADGEPIYDQRLPDHSFWGLLRITTRLYSQLRSGIQVGHVNFSHQFKYPRLSELVAYQNRRWPTPISFRST